MVSAGEFELAPRAVLPEGASVPGGEVDETRLGRQLSLGAVDPVPGEGAGPGQAVRRGAVGPDRELERRPGQRGGKLDEGGADSKYTPAQCTSGSWSNKAAVCAAGRSSAPEKPAQQRVVPIPAVEGGLRDQELRLAPNVTEVTATATESTAPSTTDRTGAASRPERPPSAARMPVTAAGDRPEADAARAMLDSRSSRPPLRGRGTVRGDQVRHRNGHRAQHRDQRHETETEHGPVEGDARVRIDRPYRPDRCQRGQPNGYGDNQQRTERHRAQDADEPVDGRHDRPRPQCPEHLAVVRVPTDQAGDDLATDRHRGEGGDEPEHGEGDRLGADDALGFRHEGAFVDLPAELPRFVLGTIFPTAALTAARCRVPPSSFRET